MSSHLLTASEDDWFLDKLFEARLGTEANGLVVSEALESNIFKSTSVF